MLLLIDKSNCLRCLWFQSLRFK